MKKKRILVAIALTCLGMSFYISSHALTKVAEHYAETMAKDIAIGYTIDRQHIEMEEQCELPFLPSPSQAYEMLEAGPPIDGWIAIFNSEGQLLEGSAGSTEAPKITQAIKSIFSEGGKRRLSLGWTKIAVVLGWDGKQVGIDGEYAVVVAVSRCLFPKAMSIERLFMCLSFYNCYAIGLFICFLASLHQSRVFGMDAGLAVRIHDNVLQILLAAVREMNLVETHGLDNVSDELARHFLKAKYILSLSIKEVRKICDENLRSCG